MCVFAGALTRSVERNRLDEVCTKNSFMQAKLKRNEWSEIINNQNNNNNKNEMKNDLLSTVMHG